MQTPPKMATGPAGPPAVSSNRTYSTTPQRVRRYLKSGVMLGGRKAGCCGGSFEHCYLLSLTIVLSERRSSTGSFERWYQLTPKIALSDRRSSTQRVHSLLERLFPGGEFWAALSGRGVWGAPHFLVRIQVQERSFCVILQLGAHQLEPKSFIRTTGNTLSTEGA